MDNKKIRTVFFGNNSDILTTLIENSNVLAIFCRKSDVDDENIQNIINIANQHDIQLKRSSKKELTAYIPYLKDLKADLFLVCGYKYIIPKDIFLLPGMCTINIHPSYLPKYRGQHVINWAIINGEKKTGVTFHLIDEGIDTGDIVAQKEIEINEGDTALVLHNKIYFEASTLLRMLLHDLSLGNKLEPIMQNSAEATYFKPRTPADGAIDFSGTGVDVYNKVRALSKPWPGAYGSINGMKMIIWAAEFSSGKNNNSSTGQIIGVDGSQISINLNDGILIIDDFEMHDNLNNIITDYIIQEGDLIV